MPRLKPGSCTGYAVNEHVRVNPAAPDNMAG